MLQCSRITVKSLKFSQTNHSALICVPNFNPNSHGTPIRNSNLLPDGGFFSSTKLVPILTFHNLNRQDYGCITS